MVMNEENKRKILTRSIVGLTMMLFIAIGATYTYFSMTLGGESSTTTANISTEENNVVSLLGGDNNLHIIVDANDMSQKNIGKEFYATNGEKNYVTNEEDHTIKFAEISMVGEITDSNICTADLNVTISGKMQANLVKGDTLLHIESGNINYDIDLTEITNPYPLEFKLTSASNPINGYLKLINTEKDQSDLASANLNVNVNITNLKCGLKGMSALALFESNSSSKTFETKEELKKRNEMVDYFMNNNEVNNTIHEEIYDTLRRFQGQVENDGKGTITNDVDNYLCFGIDDPKECVKDTNKYLYRIIGVDIKTNEIKVIKREALNSSLKWDSSSPGKTWPDSEVKNKLNGDSFLTNAKDYPYMQSDINTESTWTKLITDHNWQYGAVENYTSQKSSFEPKDTSIEVFLNEKQYITTGKWRGTLTAKIGLMYISDYTLSGGDGLLCHYVTPDSAYTECKKSWLHISNNDSLALSGANPPEQKDSIIVCIPPSSGQNNCASTWVIADNGSVTVNGLDRYSSARPVFYLDAGIKLEGKGTLTEPYYITNVDEFNS